MSSTLGWHSLRFVFALLCAVVLMRLPPVASVEDAWSSSVKVEDTIAVVADIHCDPIDVYVASARIVLSLAALTGSFSSAVHPVEHSILRL